MGPDKVVCDLLPHFCKAIGCDASPEMIEQAKLGGQKRGLAERATFVDCLGEHRADALQGSETADVVTALRPGGTLTIWTAARLYCRTYTPNAKAVQEAPDECEDRLLLPYTTAGNHMSRSAYATLPLPFDLPGLEGEFDASSFVRKQWDTDGIPSAPNNADGSPGPFLKHVETRLEDPETGLETASSVIRWREANAEKALTERIR